MSVICPTITADDPKLYKEQMERVAGFAERIHIDLADGVFTPNKLLELDDVWWPVGMTVDIHLMYKAVKPFIPQLISIKPHMVIVHAEAVGSYYEIAKPLHDNGIKVGVALLAPTSITSIIPALKDIDHVLIFSGDLGYFGGKANLRLLDKSRKLKKLKQSLEIGWDGGINIANARNLYESGVDVLNVGGGIQRSDNPNKAFHDLTKLVQK